eukprot:709387-Rhodomonas_salina.1
MAERVPFHPRGTTTPTLGLHCSTLHSCTPQVHQLPRTAQQSHGQGQHLNSPYHLSTELRQKT